MTETAQTPKHTILILEDDPQLAGAVRDALITRNLAPILVTTVEDGVNILKSGQKIDAIWLDHYLLGTGNGVDFVVEVKNHPEWRTIPIFVVSNTASAPNIRSYLELGIENFYTKADHDIMQIIGDVEAALKKGGNI
jgi:DNA-binding response OmpR family regulator